MNLTAEEMNKGRELVLRSIVVGHLGLFDNFPTLERPQYGSGDEVGQKPTRHQFYKIALIGPNSEIIRFFEGFRHLLYLFRSCHDYYLK